MEDSRKMIVVAYCRVATKNQLALDKQTERMMQFVATHPEWELVKIYSDSSEATQLSRREGLTNLIRDARQGQFDFVIVPKPSRLARSLLECYQILTTLNEAGVGVKFIDGTKADEFHHMLGGLLALGE